jgi:hypothetical protein
MMPFHTAEVVVVCCVVDGENRKLVEMLRVIGLFVDHLVVHFLVHSVAVTNVFEC